MIIRLNTDDIWNEISIPDRHGIVQNMGNFMMTSGPVANRWLQTICVIKVLCVREK